jgi:hypothetical protein
LKRGGLASDAGREVPVLLTTSYSVEYDAVVLGSLKSAEPGGAKASEIC